MKCVAACGDCRGYDCNNRNFTDCEIAETDIDPTSNEDDFNSKNMFEWIFGKFYLVHVFSFYFFFFTKFDLYFEIMKEYNLKIKHVGITENNVYGFSTYNRHLICKNAWSLASEK